MFQVVVAIFGGFYYFFGDFFSENREFLKEYYFSGINSQNDEILLIKKSLGPCHNKQERQR
jgi:hypothetical protein